MNVLLLLMACMTTGRFEDRYAAEFCQWAQDCEVLDLEGFSTLSECESQFASLPDECENYTQKSARECVEAIRSSTCEDGLSGPPKACDKVCVN